MAINITDASVERRIPPLWRMPFRPFFLASAGFSCLALPLWLLSFLQGLDWGGLGLYWHVHEMLFGFAATTVIGFALTAAQTWTGVRSAHGKTLQGLVALWLLARTGWLLDWTWLGAVGDATLFVAAAVVMGRMVVPSRNWRNAFFIPLFLLLALISLAYALLLQQQQLAAARELLVTVLLLVLHVVLVIGGRVIPFFADRRLERTPVVRHRWLELGSLLSSLLFLGCWLVADDSQWLRALAALVAVLNLLRWLSWKPWQVLRIPLLWSLYLSYLFIIAGFASIALAAPWSASLHLLAVGGFGLMILAMISRVSLGHTGRVLELPAGFTLGYAALALATVSRTAAGWLPTWYGPLLWLSVLAWLAGFGLYLWHYGPMLLHERADGRPG